MKTLILPTLICACASLSTITLANENYICHFGGSERTIKVAYSDPESNLPCEVIYEKASGTQVLWSAENIEGYCETKAAEFVEKQRGWGWDCAKTEIIKNELTAKSSVQ